VVTGTPGLLVGELNVELEQHPELLGAGLEQRGLVDAGDASVVDAVLHGGL
jgi:hypothetical protein